ncbi:uncharacterized protein [Chelonus insularis]|uniref:uncharacterized protein n=1 Tax=Chelonus insularis TaxID=460826 RepID=UPI00158CCD72|nr:uncharacterized protein LOC118072271 [Chelonus insularis]
MLMLGHLSFLLVSTNASTIPEIISYAKVSRNGASSDESREGRNFQASPVYSKIASIGKGEVVEYPLVPKYSTLDKEMVAKLDAKTMDTQQAQDRFHPPASFEHAIAHSNKLRLSQNPASSGSSGSPSLGSSSSSIASGSYSTLPKELYSQYPGFQEASSPPKNANKNLPSITIDDYSPVGEDSFSQIPASYGPEDSYQNDEKLPSFIKNNPAKPGDQFSELSYHHSSYFDDPYLHNHDHDSDHIYPHELIYDHPPDHYDHDYTTTTQIPEMNDQRLNKRPYSYYYIGKKLWYLPLYFSIYFIIYIAALILKSIARHKINFPANLAEAAASDRSRHLNDRGWWDLTQRVLEAIEKFAVENGKQSSNSRRKR